MANYICGYFLKNDEGIYLKDIDTANGEIFFTKNIEEARNFTNGSWFSDNQLEFIRFHFKDREEIETMKTVYEEVTV